MMTKDKSIIAVIVVVALVAALSLINSNTKKIEIDNSQPLSIQSWKSDTGAKVMYVYAPQLPMVDIRLVFDAGSVRDKGLPGLAMMTNAMLDLGAGDWSTDMIAERFDGVGAEFSNNSLKDMAILSLRSLTEEALLDTSITTLNAILTKPKFIETEIQRTREQVLISLRNHEQSTSTIASKAFYKALYSDHAYASPVMGAVESINKITRDELIDFYKKYYVANNAVIAIVGDVDKSEAEDLVEQILKGLPEGEAAVQVDEVKPLNKAQKIHKTYPSSQTHILVGQPGMKRGDEDYLALYVGNHILGGSGFGSRIVEEIREKRGLAYSSYSYFSPMRENGPFTLGLQTATKNTQQALTILDEVLREFIDVGPNEKELQHAKNNITGGFALKVDSNKDIIGYLGMIGFYNLPLDYLKTFNERVEQVTKEQIQTAFKRRIDPDKLITITVGNDQ